MAVLVNRGTYGAAELAAAAIEDAKRGDVVGERTFGEGSVQKTIELPDGAALLLTVAKYESPSRQQDPGQRRHAQRGRGTARTTRMHLRQPAPKGDETLNKALELLKAKSS